MQKKTPTINPKEYQTIAFQVLELLKKDKSIDSDFSAPATKIDIWDLKENISKLELKMERLRTDLIEKIANTDLKIENIRTDLIEKIANTDLKIENIRTDLIEKIANTDLKIEKKLNFYQVVLLLQKFYSKNLKRATINKV